MHLTSLQVRESPGVVRATIPGGALSGITCRELNELCADTRERRDVHVVVVSCNDSTLGSNDRRPPSVALGTDPAMGLALLPQIVVGAVEGTTSGEGVELLLACDLRVAGAGASFELSGAARGEVPSWGGTQRLPRLAGRALALRMLLLGEVVGASQACASGLVTHVAAAGCAEATADELAATLCRQAPLAIEYTKEAVVRGVEMSMRDGLGLEADLNLLLQSSSDRREGIDAFLGKRTPHFEGR